MKRHLPLLLLVGLFGSAVTATAHTSQFHSQDMAGASWAGFLHPLTGLDHLLVMVVVGLWAVQIGGRALWLLPSSFVGSMMIGGAMGLGLCGVHQTFVEHGILASIVMLGAALGMAWRPSLLISSLCVGAAGICHGYAHGSEMPSGALPIMFFVGIVIATSLLHACGVGGGFLFRNQKFAILMRTAGLFLIAFAVYDFYFPV
ncbi:MAG: HupE/UreJ family protein [Chthoniobacterales bacterium]|nr:HupE/UreJ family protein [Chthoniobacterales bacterium]